MKQLRDFRVGDTFRVVRTCDRYRPVYYAAVSGDFNPIHIDPELVRHAGHAAALLQGMCTMGWAADACVRYFEDPARIRRLRARFSKPVHAGDVVTVEGRCVSVEGGLVRVELAARNQSGEEVLRNGLAEGLVGEEG